MFFLPSRRLDWRHVRVTEVRAGTFACADTIADAEPDACTDTVANAEPDAVSYAPADGLPDALSDTGSYGCSYGEPHCVADAGVYSWQAPCERACSMRGLY